MIFRTLTTAVFATALTIVFTLMSTAILALEAPEPAVNRLLETHQARWVPARIEHVGGPVHMATGFDFSNIVFIEGETSTLVIDWGMLINNTAKALAAYREINDKPIKTLILTHPHGDHFGGVGGLFPDGIPSDVTVIGPANDYMEADQANELRPTYQGEMYRGLFLQIGALLPAGPEGTVGAGVGPPTVFGPRSALPAFTETLTASKSMTIDGIKLEFIYAPGDLVEHYAVWLPDQAVLITGDLPALMYFVTPRQEQTRDIDNMINSTRMLAEFPAEHTLNFHSPRIYRGQEGRAMLIDAHDFLKLVRDQTYRAINNNKSQEDLIADFPMPPRFANNPDMRDHYHHFSWMLRGLYTKKVGWFGGEMAEIVKPLAKEESIRMAALAGGEKKLWEAAKAAYEKEDFGWAVQLTAHLLRLQPDNQDYKQLKAYAQRSIAYRSHVANERHFLLTDAMALEGKLGAAELAQINAAMGGDVRSQPVANLLNDFLGARLRAEECLDYNASVVLEISDQEQQHTLQIREGVSVYSEGGAPDAINTARLSSADFYDIFLGQLSWRGAVDQRRVEITGDADSFYAFINFFDW